MDNTINKIINSVKDMTFLAEGEDCSECVERVKNKLGRGRIKTFAMCDNNGILKAFYIPLDTKQFSYHTVLVVKIDGVKYVIDITVSPHKVFEYDKYTKVLKMNNQLQLAEFNGIVGEDIINKIYLKDVSGYKII